MNDRIPAFAGDRELDQPKRRAPRVNFMAIRLATRRLIEAEVAHSWKGGGDPGDIPDIEIELAQARAQFEYCLKENP